MSAKAPPARTLSLGSFSRFFFLASPSVPRRIRTPRFATPTRSHKALLYRTRIASACDDASARPDDGSFLGLVSQFLPVSLEPIMLSPHMTSFDSFATPVSRLPRRVVSLLLLGIGVACLASGCRKSSSVSAAQCKEHVAMLGVVAKQDLEEIRKGLPQGAKFLEEFVSTSKFDDASASREALDRARNKVQDLRVAKASFFALVDLAGVVVRSDNSPDLLAGKNLFEAFPDLRPSTADKYVEARGAIEAASKIKGGPDAQWVAATPVHASGAVKAVYAAGWSWSAYAYRLQNHLQSKIRGALPERGKEPLTYVYMVVGDSVFGAPISPAVNARAILDQHFLSVGGAEPIVRELDITEREFGMGFLRLPELGKDVGVAVLRSET